MSLSFYDILNIRISTDLLNQSNQLKLLYEKNYANNILYIYLCQFYVCNINYILPIAYSVYTIQLKPIHEIFS